MSLGSSVNQTTLDGFVRAQCAIAVVFPEPDRTGDDGEPRRVRRTERHRDPSPSDLVAERRGNLVRP